MIPTLVGRPMMRYDGGMPTDFQMGDLQVGEDANTYRSMLQLKRPIENGIVKHWDDMEAVWNHTFKQLGINPREHKIVQTEAALNPRGNREKMVGTMLETFEFDAVNVSVQAILALNSQ